MLKQKLTSHKLPADSRRKQFNFRIWFPVHNWQSQAMDSNLVEVNNPSHFPSKDVDHFEKMSRREYHSWDFKKIKTSKENLCLSMDIHFLVNIFFQQGLPVVSVNYSDLIFIILIGQVKTIQEDTYKCI